LLAHRAGEGGWSVGKQDRMVRTLLSVGHAC